MRVTINDHVIVLPEHLSLSALFTYLDQPTQGHAIAVNDTVIPHVRWSEHRLSDGNVVLLIQSVAGG